MASTDINVCTFTGRVGGDPESRADGKLRTFGLAVTNYGGAENPEVTMWLTCNLWGVKNKVADYIKKGMKLTVTGSLENREYNDKWYWTLNVDRVTLPDRDKSGAQVGDTSEAPKAKTSRSARGKAPVTDSTADDGLPF
jgi:single-stranded DNA-binding protein